MSAIEIVKTPTEEWLRPMVSSCEHEFLVSSPYINGGFNKLIGNLSDQSLANILTKTCVSDFVRGSSSIDSLCELAKNGAKIRSLPSLHAKVYIIDEKCAIVTSANATYSGFYRNVECGLALYDPEDIAALRCEVLSGFGTKYPISQWNYGGLIELADTVSNLKPLVKSFEVIDDNNYDEQEIALIVDSHEARELLDSVTGWKRLALKGVISQPNDVFTTADIYNYCIPLANQEYNNNNPEAKLRQQLQELRDMGFVDFVDNSGTYRRKFKVK